MTEHNKPIQIECNRASDDFMFATRSQDGRVRIWDARDAPPRVIRVDTAGLSVNVTDHLAGNGASQRQILTESPQTELPGESATGVQNEGPN
jgi:hypothetical protein